MRDDLDHVDRPSFPFDVLIRRPIRKRTASVRSRSFCHLLLYDIGQPTETRPALRLIGRSWSQDPSTMRPAGRRIQRMLSGYRIKHARPAVHSFVGLLGLRDLLVSVSEPWDNCTTAGASGPFDQGYGQRKTPSFQPLKGCALSTVISVGADQSRYSLLYAMVYM